MKISVVICVYNEQANIAPLISNTDLALKGLDFEVIIVDDGSTDETVNEVYHHSRPWIKLVRLTKNYGQSSALAAGINQAGGDFIVTMDGDLQNDPLDIPEMITMIETRRCDIVAGYRQNRKDSIIRTFPSKLANMMIRRTTGVNIIDYGCTLKVFRGCIAKNLKIYGELHRFIPVLAALEGYTKIVQVPVRHHPRQHGKSKYNLNRTLKVISDLLLLVFFRKYMQKPMHFFGPVGVLLTLTGIIINVYLLVLKLAGHDIWGKPLLMLGVILLLGGLQFITTGLVAEMLMRTYFESQQKKPYNIRSVKKFETTNQKIYTGNRKVAHK
ncbi:MAG TPA: glycosyltransferase family 2 protein [Bacteroidales bacterium]|nr:glycosyltransferase family 2 protein [Bacteroidales bacterium]